MNRSKKLIHCFVTFITSCGLLSCSSNEEKKSGDVKNLVWQFYIAIGNQDFDNASTCFEWTPGVDSAKKMLLRLDNKYGRLDSFNIFAVNPANRNAENNQLQPGYHVVSTVYYHNYTTQQDLFLIEAHDSLRIAAMTSNIILE